MKLPTNSWKERALASERNFALQVDETRKQEQIAKNWQETAAQFSRNSDFYRDLVRQIGQLFGVEARTSDDGSIQDEVLALKVPELVNRLFNAQRDAQICSQTTQPQATKQTQTFDQ